jgi:hypothetical protein
MLKSPLLLVAPLLVLAATAAPAAIVGVDGQACQPGRPPLVVRVSGFEQPSGMLQYRRGPSIGPVSG